MANHRSMSETPRRCDKTATVSVEAAAWLLG
jgi:hypothetical protein